MLLDDATKGLVIGHATSDEDALDMDVDGILRFMRSNLSILKEISPEHSLEGLMLKLKLQYFGQLLRRTDSLEKT